MWQLGYLRIVAAYMKAAYMKCGGMKPPNLKDGLSSETNETNESCLPPATLEEPLNAVELDEIYK